MDPRSCVTTMGGVFHLLRGCSFLLGSVWIHLYCVSITNSIVYPRRSYNHNFSCANHPVLLQENPSSTLNTPPKPPAPMFCLYIRCISHLNCLGAYISPRLDPSTSIIFISGQFLEELQIFWIKNSARNIRGSYCTSSYSIAHINLTKNYLCEVCKIISLEKRWTHQNVWTSFVVEVYSSVLVFQ